jgi:hypothetical protein
MFFREIRGAAFRGLQETQEILEAQQPVSVELLADGVRASAGDDPVLDQRVDRMLLSVTLRLWLRMFFSDLADR